MTIKPIETQFDGYKFRSRLEARWAVYFDELGLDWAYEPDGFDIDGEWYLPDFRIDGLFSGDRVVYIEIKRPNYDRSDNYWKAWHKIRKISKLKNVFCTYLIMGFPNCRKYADFRGGNCWSRPKGRDTSPSSMKIEYIKNPNETCYEGAEYASNYRF